MYTSIRNFLLTIFRRKALEGLALLAAVCLPGLFSSCDSPDGPPYEGEQTTPQIIFLFSPGGLGDMSYNDCILQGVQRFKISHPEVDVFLYSPSSIEVAERIFSDWIKRPGSDIPVLFTLASSDYEGLADLYLPLHPLTDNKRILLFESTNDYGDPRVSTFQVSMYGASYLAGATARECVPSDRSLVLLGSSSDAPIRSARDGFIEGLGHSKFDVEYLSEDWTGFVMADVTYRKMTDWASRYGFIFPVAGGSNAGIYRYAREFNDSPFLAGMDIDQSDFASKITGSVIKRLDSLVYEYLTHWLLTGEVPGPVVYGIESGYADWLLSPRYESLYSEAVEKARPLAIEKEREYHEITD